MASGNQRPQLCEDMLQNIYIATYQQDLRAVQAAAVPGFVQGVRDGFCPNYSFVLSVYTLRCRNKTKEARVKV